MATDLTGIDGVISSDETITPLNTPKYWQIGTIDDTYAYWEFRAAVSDYGIVYCLARDDNPNSGSYERYRAYLLPSDENIRSLITKVESGGYRHYFLLLDAVA